MANLLKINNIDEFILNNNLKKEVITNSNINEPKQEVITNTNTNNDIIEVKEEVITNININEPKQEIISNTKWWYPSKNGKKRILWAGTHIHQSNGYSRVMYYITKYLGNYEDIELTIYGFQNFNTCTDIQKVLRCDIHPTVKIYDAYANEDPKRNGFGEKEIGEYIKKYPQDIIIIFKDP